MADQETATNSNVAENEEQSSLMDTAVQDEKDTSVLDQAAQEEKSENEKLMATDDKELAPDQLEKKQELVKAAEAEKVANAVPEKYEFKVPEGMQLDQAMVDKITPVFKEAKLSQGTAQKLADIYAEQIQTGMKEFEVAQKANYEKFVEGLKAETIKALGPEYKKELAFAARARDRFASPELVQKLNISGLANDKDMIALFIKAGKLISEDKVVEGQSATTTDKNDLDTLYDAGKK